MNIEKIKQSIKNLVEASYEYDSLVSRKSPKSKTEDLKKYMMHISLNINSLVEAELENVRH